MGCRVRHSPLGWPATRSEASGECESASSALASTAETLKQHGQASAWELEASRSPDVGAERTAECKERRKLEKLLREIAELEAAEARGAVLRDNQKEKVAKKASSSSRLAELREP